MLQRHILMAWPKLKALFIGNIKVKIDHISYLLPTAYLQLLLQAQSCDTTIETQEPAVTWTNLNCSLPDHNRIQTGINTDKILLYYWVTEIK